MMGAFCRHPPVSSHATVRQDSAPAITVALASRRAVAFASRRVKTPSARRSQGALVALTGEVAAEIAAGVTGQQLRRRIWGSRAFRRRLPGVASCCAHERKGRFRCRRWRGTAGADEARAWRCGRRCRGGCRARRSSSDGCCGSGLGSLALVRAGILAQCPRIGGGRSCAATTWSCLPPPS
jgi:hypothetical protein